jgi:hypothetical protein
MTIGRNNEAPAAYALTSTIKRLLDHLTEANLFSAKDLDSMSQTLERVADIVHTNSTRTSAPFLNSLLSSRIERCHETLNNLRNRLDDFAEPILATHERLISILRQLAVINTKANVYDIPCATFSFNLADFISQTKPEDIVKVQLQLKDVENKKVEGHFRDEDGSILTGSDQVSTLLARCQHYAEVVKERQAVALRLSGTTANTQQSRKLSGRMETHLRRADWDSKRA